MQLIAFLFFKGFSLLLSLLPLRALYIFSDVFYIILYHFIGYRKKVVFTNLKNSFPEKNNDEIVKISKLFYRNLCDVITENIKSISLSKEELFNRCRFKNPEVNESLYPDHQNVILVLGHYCNWEWTALAASASASHKVKAVYKPLSNSYFDGFMKKLRGKFGMEVVPMKQVFKNILMPAPNPFIIIFLSDQTPVDIQNCHWMNFMQQDTPVFIGVEKIAKRTGYPVVFAKMEKIKRGYYNVEYIPVTMNPKETSEGEITETHTKLLEKSINENPENWLWSHRRWKRKRSK